jgi:purine-binding chemotaxis protein CheW
MNTASGAVSLQYLTFFVAEEEYAVPVLKVREVIEYDTVTRVPSTPPWIRGVINLRGTVVPVVDLAVKFGLAASPVTRRTCIVLVEVQLDGQETVMGAVADSVSQVIELAASDIEPPPSFGTHVRVDFLLGMGKLDAKFALLLDIDRVLSADELLIARETAPAPESGDGEAPADDLPPDGEVEAPPAAPEETEEP